MPEASAQTLTIGFLRRGYSSSGGVEVYLKGLAQGLHAQGHRVILFGTKEWPKAEWPGGEILRCQGNTLATYIKEIERQKVMSGKHFDLIMSVEKVPGCDLYRTDEGLHLAWLKERSLTLTPWARWFQWCNPKHREKLLLERALFHADSTRRVISISDKITRDIVKFYDYPLEQICMIRNGVPQISIPSNQQRLQAREALGVKSEEKIVLFVGTGWERKGLRVALKAVELCAQNDSSIRLLIAGKGPAHRYASSIATFLGPVKAMKNLYHAGDLFITPTIYEPFSLAALEALSAGIPVITSAAAGISEVMIPGVHGAIIDDSLNVEKFAVALREWLSKVGDPSQTPRIQSDCSTLASAFSLQRNLTETLNLIHEVIEEKRSTARCI